MFYRLIACSLVYCAALFSASSVNLSRSFFEGKQLTAPDVSRLESAIASTPEDLEDRAQLLGFYSGSPANDSAFSNRFRHLTWLVEHHPESEVLGMPGLWNGIPEAIFQQFKPQWIAQVHQHADDPNVLRSAASFLISKNAQPIPSGIRIGGAVAAANLISQTKPAYPPLASQARVQGTVRFNATIGVDGHVKDLQLMSGHPLLIDAAKEAVEQWAYKPTLLNGNPVQVLTTIDVNFTLNGPAQ